MTDAFIAGLYEKGWLKHPHASGSTMRGLRRF